MAGGRAAPLGELLRTGGGWNTALAVRYVGLVALAVAVLLLPSLGPDRASTAVVILAIGIPANAAVQVLSRLLGRPPTLMPFIDVLAAGAVILYEPAVFVPGLTVLIAVISLASVSSNQTVTAAAAGLATIILTVVVTIDEPASGWVGLAGFAISAAIVTATVGSLAERERNLRRQLGGMVEGIDAIVWQADPRSGRYTYTSPTAERILGYALHEESVAGFVTDHVHTEDQARALTAFEEAVRTGQDGELEYRVRSAAGTTAHLRDRISVETNGEGRVQAIRGITIDVSEQRQAEEQVRQYADVVERIQVALMILRPDREDDLTRLRFVAANPAAERATGVPVANMVGRRMDEVLPQVLTSSLPELLVQVLQTGRPYDRDNVILPPDDRRVFSVHAFPLPGGAVGVSLDDVTGASMAAAALRRQALHDELTGLANRTALKSKLREALGTAHRSRRAAALLMLDLDQFKEVNDALGHHIGDLLLVELSRRLEEVLRDCSLVARLGGDEFAVLMTEGVTEERAVAVADRIGRMLQEPFCIDNLTLQTGASIGIALFPDHAGDADSLTQRADVAMYLAKRTGVGHAVYATEQDHSSVRRLTLLADLRRGLELSQFRMVYQPVLELRTRRVVRAEALIRWQHPEHGLLPPSEFVGLAEVSGVIQPLTRWVLEQSLAAAGQWRRTGHPLGVACNLSVRNLYDSDLPRFLEQALASGGCLPKHLTLEITESELMEDPALARDVLDALQRLGVATAIDDFGTGYSSLTYLKDLPVDQIKIDRSFVVGMSERAENLAIVRSMIELAHSLGLEVVAEGVPDEAVLDQLTTLGCDLAQGFYLSPPLNETELMSWMAPADLPRTSVVAPAANLS